MLCYVMHIAGMTSLSRVGGDFLSGKVYGGTPAAGARQCIARCCNCVVARETRNDRASCRRAAHWRRQTQYPRDTAL